MSELLLNNHSALYLNAFKLPFFADFNTPETYGLARESSFCKKYF